MCLCCFFSLSDCDPVCDNSEQVVMSSCSGDQSVLDAFSVIPVAGPREPSFQRQGVEVRGANDFAPPAPGSIHFPLHHL